VIAVDTNILVYAHREDASFHERAAKCLADLAQGRMPWSIPWPCLHEFLAIVTHPRIYDPPTPLTLAIEQVDAWLESPTLVLLAESDQYWPDLKAVAGASQVTGPRIHDARIAALCLQHGVQQLWSADRDFGRFSDLRVINPLTQ
jgi:uncharacterized protein